MSVFLGNDPLPVEPFKPYNLLDYVLIWCKTEIFTPRKRTEEAFFKRNLILENFSPINYKKNMFLIVMAKKEKARQINIGLSLLLFF